MGSIPIESVWVRREIEEGDVLYDGRTADLLRVVAVSHDGVTLRRRDRERYLPHAVFFEWYDPAHVTRNAEIPTALARRAEPPE